MRKGNRAAAWLLLYTMGGAVWAVLMLIKALGGAYIMGWLPLGLGIIWIPAALTLLVILVVRLMLPIAKICRRYREWKRRKKVAHTLWDAMHGLTLNSVGPIYGVQRKAGEPNKEYERRILKAARTVDKINPAAPLAQPHKPATGLKLDALAAKHGLKRNPGESDAALQERIRTAVIEKLERRQKHGI